MKFLPYALIALLCTAPMAQAQKVQFDYRKLDSIQQDLRPVSGSRYLKPGLRLNGPGFLRSTQAIELTVKTLEADITLRVDPNGNFDLPSSARLREENPQIWSNIESSTGEVKVEPSLRIEAPARQQFDYQLIAAMREEFNQSRGMVSRFFSPSLRGVIIDFGTPGQFSADVDANGIIRKYQSEDSGYLRLPANDQLIGARATVQLSAMPVAIRLEME
jgi:hypothetical protein